MTPDRYIIVHGAKQILEFINQGKIIFTAPVSTALKGFGEVEGSEQTPRGWLQVSEKMGEGLPINSVFVGRKATGEIYNEVLAAKHPERDWILTRILWLSGLEAHNANSKERYIYVHGTPDINPMGVPLSHGCIRMRNGDILKLFDLVNVGTKVLVEE